MPFDTSTLQGIILATLTSLIVGGLKYLGPKVRDRIPNFVWPIAVLVLARIGTNVCVELDAACDGNPLGWGSEEAAALAVAFLAMVQREFWVKAYPWLLAQAAKLGVSIQSTVDRTTTK